MNYKIPYFVPSSEEISKQMRINQEILCREISQYVDDEIKRFKDEIEKIKNDRTKNNGW